ncbi:MAG TPA: aminotransferase class V-fold PLP-dependent enzyme [Mycobacteriales bacterium]|nr:aminotransferase class V-fold PLP-dependent enzyme [Mycobacteriales bacterium]
MAEIDVGRVRADTPGCAEVVHLNNAGAALMPRPVFDATVGHLSREALTGGYEAADAAAERLEHGYHAIAALLRCDASEVAMVENATRAWDMAFYAIGFRPGDRILTGRAEYTSNVIAFLQVAERTGAVVQVVPDDEHGQISVAALRGMLDERVRLVALTHVPTNSGLVNPAAEVGAAAREAGALVLLDACQSAGQLDLDVTALGCDMLSATGRKYLRGPRGTGFLYVASAVLDRLTPPLLDLRSAELTGPREYRMRPDARRFETWETSVAGRLGLGAAVDYALGLGLTAIETRVGRLAETLRQRLREIPGVRVHDRGVRRCGIVTFTVAGRAATAVQTALSRQRINVNVVAPTAAGPDLPVRDPSDSDRLVRASVHYYNTDDEVDRLHTVLTSALRSGH